MRIAIAAGCIEPSLFRFFGEAEPGPSHPNTITRVGGREYSDSGKIPIGVKCR